MARTNSLTFSGYGTGATTVVKAAPGTLQSLYASNSSSALRYLLIYNRATTPSSNGSLRYSFPIPAGTPAAPGSIVLGTDFFGAEGQDFTSGIGIAISSVNATLDGSSISDVNHNYHINYN